MDSKASSRLPFRLQFTLRGLLLVVLLTGIALTIYRWPWEVTVAHERSYLADGQPDLWKFRGKVDPDHKLSRENELLPGRDVTTYRRNWRGKPVAYGLKREFIAERLMTEIELRDDLRNGLSRYFNGLGEITEETQYRGGNLHGTFRVGNGTTWTHVGQYWQNKKDGAWRVLQDRQLGPPLFWCIPVSPTELAFSPRPQEWSRVPENAIVVQEQWRRGARHGHWEWRTVEGELLNSADYVANELTHWNGAAVRPWLESLHRQCATDPELVATLQQPLLKADHSPNRAFAYARGFYDDWLADHDAPVSVTTPEVCSVVHFETHRTSSAMLNVNQSVGANLLEAALLNGLTPQFRYGGLWFVPASECGEPFRDPTGVDLIRFEPGSPQALAWEEPVELRNDQVAGAFDWLAYLLEGSSIALDLRWFQDHKGDRLQPSPSRYRTFRKRRDAVGFVLYRTGLRCEQRENALVIQGHWTRLDSYRQFEPGRTPSWRTSPMPDLQLLE